MRMDGTNKQEKLHVWLIHSQQSLPQAAWVQGAHRATEEAQQGPVCSECRPAMHKRLSDHHGTLIPE